MATTSAPSWRRRRGASADAAPLAQSTTTRSPSSRRPSSERPRGGRRRRRPGSGSSAQPSHAVRRSGAPGPVPGPGSRSSSASMAASIGSVSFGPAGGEQLDAVVGEGVVGGGDDRRRDGRARPTARPRPASAARRGRPRRRPRRPARPARAAWSSGPDRRVSRPTRNSVAGDGRGPRPARGRAPARGSARRWRPPGRRRCRTAAPRPTTGSALGVLRRLAGLLQAVLLRSPSPGRRG